MPAGHESGRLDTGRCSSLINSRSPSLSSTSKSTIYAGDDRPRRSTGSPPNSPGHARGGYDNTVQTARAGVARLATNVLQKEKAALIHLPQDQCRMNSFLRIAAPARPSAHSATTTISTRRLLAFDPNGRSGPKLASEIRLPSTFFAIKNLRTAYARSNPR